MTKFRVKGTLESILKRAMRIDKINNLSRDVYLSYKIYLESNEIDIEICKREKR
jgi:hypothetical protein